MKYPLKLVLLLTATLSLTQCRTVTIESENRRQIARFKEPMAPAEMLGVNYLPSDILMPGEYMQVFGAAYGAFLVDADIPEHKRKVENYRIEFHKDNKHYKVSFIAKRTPSELGQLEGGESELGKDVTYVVDKKTFQVAYRIFYK